MARRRDRRGRLRRGAGGGRGALRGAPRSARASGGRRFDHLHPGKAAETDAGWLGELHPALLDGSWGAFELDVEALMAPIPERILYDDVITYPANRQDIAVAVGEDVEVGALVAAAHEAAGPELREVRPFDVYRGEQVGDGRKSVALHLVFQSAERTLSDDEVSVLRDRIVAALGERFDAELRVVKTDPDRRA